MGWTELAELRRAERISKLRRVEKTIAEFRGADESFAEPD